MVVIPRRPSSSVRSGEGICLGIDQSYNNLAIVQLHGDRFTPVVGHFIGKKAMSNAQEIMRMVDVEAWLAGVLSVWTDVQIDAIAMEDYARGRVFRQPEAGELGSIVKLALMQHLGRVPAIVGTSQLKKFVLGTGKADKSDMKLGVYKRWGLDTKDDNVADAAGLAKIARALCDGEDGLTGAQREVLSALGNDTSWRLTRQQLQRMGQIPAVKR